MKKRKQIQEWCKENDVTHTEKLEYFFYNIMECDELVQAETDMDLTYALYQIMHDVEDDVEDVEDTGMVWHTWFVRAGAFIENRYSND